MDCVATAGEAPRDRLARDPPHALAREPFRGFFQECRQHLGRLNPIAGLLQVMLELLPFTGWSERLVAFHQPWPSGFPVTRL